MTERPGSRLLAAIDLQILSEDLERSEIALLREKDLFDSDKLTAATVESLVAVGLSQATAQHVKTIFPTR
jgi:hypothetical protein